MSSSMTITIKCSNADKATVIIDKSANVLELKEKIAEQLRKASVSIVNITPGKETISYLENVVRSTSILGGIFLCFILVSYDFLKQIINGPLLNQINISSLIILVGVSYEIQKNVRALYKNMIDPSI